MEPLQDDAELGLLSTSTKSSRFSWQSFLRLVLAFLALGLCVGCFVLLKKESGKRTLQILRHGDDKPALLKFLVVGDWGRKGLYNQSLVATQMGRIGKEIGIQFVISTGDNFYERGLKGVNDSLFGRSFTNVYTASSLQTTWYTVLGNHDYMGDVIAQLSEEIVTKDSRWFCRRDLELSFPFVDLFFIDTTPFIDEYWLPNVSTIFDWRGLAPREQQLRFQLQNLTQKLQASTAKWKAVIGHHTIRSIGHHGDSPELLRQVLPILEAQGVDLYINGHDHNLQYIQRLDSPVHFITSGGGSKAWSGLREATKEDGVQFAFDGQGFLAVSVEFTSFSFSFYDVFGDVLSTFSIRK